MRHLLLWLFSLLAVSIGRAQTLTEPQAAFDQAQALDRPVLLVFSGSDWCAPCIHLERQVLADSVFQRYAAGHIVVLKADFPQQTKLSPTLLAAYERLADAYNREGAFPKLVVISPDRSRVTPLSSFRQTPATLVAQLRRLLP